MYRKTLANIVAAGMLAAPLVGAEVWLVRFSVRSGSCSYIGWADTITLHNRGEVSATVRLLGVSNGAMPNSSSTVSLAPHQTKLRDSLSGDDWRPTRLPPLWVARLDVPAGVVVTSLADVNQIGCSVNPGGAHVARRGAIPLPVFLSLVPANQRHVHLRTDIGFAQSPASFGVIPNRINVGIYNAGLQDGTAAVEVRRVCDDGLIERRTVQVPANSIQQFGGFSNPGATVDTCNTFTPYETYVTVTLDQPGFSYALALANDSPPFIPIGMGGGS